MKQKPAGSSFMQLIRGREFEGFVVVGLLSTICNLASRYLFELFGPFELALIGANAVGVITAFFMNRWFVFQSRSEAVFAEGTRFLLVNLVGIALAWVVAVVLYRVLFPAWGIAWHADLLAHAIGIAAPVLPNYFAHRCWTFDNSPKE
jgi:putative flippase GtrA